MNKILWQSDAHKFDNYLMASFYGVLNDNPNAVVKFFSEGKWEAPLKRSCMPRINSQANCWIIVETKPELKSVDYRCAEGHRMIFEFSDGGAWHTKIFSHMDDNGISSYVDIDGNNWNYGRPKFGIWNSVQDNCLGYPIPDGLRHIKRYYSQGSGMFTAGGLALIPSDAQLISYKITGVMDGWKVDDPKNLEN
jgi:hypothetical protein